MGIFSRFERKVEDTFEGSANRMFDAPISPVQIAKKAEKQMRREKMVGAGKQYAPTLYTVLVNDEDDRRLFGYYPTLAGETETYLAAKAAEEGLVMDGQPLVRFIADESLKRGKFDIVAEPVAAPIVAQLRQEEMQRYGLAEEPAAQQPAQAARPAQAAAQPVQQPAQQQPAQQPIQQQNAYDPYNHNSSPFDAQLYSPEGEMPEQEALDALYGQPAQGAPNQAYNEAPQQKEPLPYVPEDEIDYSIDYGEYTFNSEEFTDQQRERSQRNSQPFGNDQDYYRQQEVLADARNANVPQQDVPMATPAYEAYSNPAQAAPPMNAPDTVVFAAGSGNAAPTPQPSMVRARLVNITENRAYDLATARLILGRDINSTITVDDVNASRTHAEIRLEPQGAWSITDLGSTNGTFVNGQEVTSQYLNNNDKITIGITTFVFTFAL